MITFDDQTHTYKRDGKPVKGSVTKVITDCLPYRDLPAMAGAMQKGTANHACYALIARGKAFDCDPISEPYVTGCLKFLQDTKLTVVRVEHHMVSRCGRWGGTADLIAAINGQLVMCDYKAHVCPVRTPVQLAAYAEMWNAEQPGAKITQGLGIEISGDGKYRLEWYKLADHIAGWHSLVLEYLKKPTDKSRLIVAAMRRKLHIA